jgi:peptidoglycan/LPS O-acetylase OafA/YrhL
VAAAYAVTWVIRVGPATASMPLRWLGSLLGGFFNLPFLRLLGRHSLQVYAWHVVVIYLLKTVDYNWGPFSEATKTAIALTGIALLALPALILDRSKAALPKARVEPSVPDQRLDARPRPSLADKGRG